MFSLLIVNVSITQAAYNPDEFRWVKGGQKIELGNQLADITLDSKFLFLPTDELIKFLKTNGNIPSGYEVGSIHPVNLEENWLVVFEYHPVGFVSDSDIQNMNAESLLSDYISGTKQSNKQRGVDKEVEIIGWRNMPEYNSKLHELTYSIMFKDVYGKTQINYFVRLLSRHGYMSVTLITDVTRYDDDLKTMKNEILPFFEWKEDRKYEAYNKSTDGQSKLNLSQLIKQSLGIEGKSNEEVTEENQSNNLKLISSKGLMLTIFVAFILLIAVMKRRRRD